MGPIASRAARSGVAAGAVFVLFVAASVVLLDAPMEWRMRALRRSFTDLPMLTAVATGWLAYFCWLGLDARRESRLSHGRLVGASLAIVTSLLISLGVVVLYEGVYRLLFSTVYFHGFPWRYWLRLFEAALFAVVMVRIALPLLPRMDRMSPRNS